MKRIVSVLLSIVLLLRFAAPVYAMVPAWADESPLNVQQDATTTEYTEPAIEDNLIPIAMEGDVLGSDTIDGQGTEKPNGENEALDEVQDTDESIKDDLTESTDVVNDLVGDITATPTIEPGVTEQPTEAPAPTTTPSVTVEPAETPIPTAQPTETPVPAIAPTVELLEEPSEAEEMELNVFDAAASNGVTDFVTRLYQVCLNRAPDQAGLNDWVGKLKSGQINGATTAAGFVFSKEFQNMNLCNECFVTYMYRAFFGREPDAGGKADWLGKLNAGSTRGAIFNGFIGSQEFTKLCASYGVTRGEGDWSGSDFKSAGVCKSCGKDATAGIKSFVTRLYQVCLNRTPDTNGLNDWVGKLLRGENNGAATAAGFVFSQEFSDLNLCNNCFVTYMYRAFFGREPDQGGLSNWVGQLNNGATRGAIFNGFIGSQEFTKLCASYGVTRGEGDWSNNNPNPVGRCKSCGSVAPAPTTAPKPTQAPTPTNAPANTMIKVYYNWNNFPLHGDCDYDTHSWIVGKMPKHGSLEVKAGTKFSELKLPTSTTGDDIFLGWYIDENPDPNDYTWRSTGGTKVTADTVFTQNTELYAHWKYNVTEDTLNDLFVEVVDKYMTYHNQIIEGIPGFDVSKRINQTGNAWTATTEQAMLNIKDRELKYNNPVNQWALAGIWKICDTSQFTQYSSLRAYIHMAAQAIAWGIAGDLSFADRVTGTNYIYPGQSQGNYAFVKTSTGYTVYFIECMELNSATGDTMYDKNNSPYYVLKQKYIDNGYVVRDKIRTMPTEWVWYN